MNYLTMAFVLIIGASAQAQTPPPGCVPLSGTTTINQTFSAPNYCLSGDYKITNNATVEFAAGVTIYLNGYSIKVAVDMLPGFSTLGTLKIMGSAAAPVTIYGGVNVSGNNGIIFEDSSVDATYGAGGIYTGGSTLQHCKLIGCRTQNLPSAAPGGAVHVHQCSPYLLACDMSGGRGLTADGAHGLRVEGGRYDGNDYAGILIEGSANVSILGLSASRNKGGIRVVGQSANLLVKNCTIAGNTDESGLFCDGAGSGVIRDCFIAKNRSIIGGFGGGLRIVTQGAFEIINCDIVGNSAGIGGGVYFGPGLQMGVHLFRNSRLIGNTATGGGGIFIDEHINMAGNPTTGQHCVILGNSVNDVYENMAFGGGNFVDATNNCWGVYSVATPGRIHDNAVNPGLAIVLTPPEVACGAWHGLGGAVPGAGGAPVLQGTGLLTGPSTLTISGAAPSAVALLGVRLSLHYEYLPLIDTFLAPGFDGSTLLLPIATDAAGAWSISLPPLGLPPMLLLTLQAAIVDATSANGLVSITNGLVGES